MAQKKLDLSEIQELGKAIELLKDAGLSVDGIAGTEPEAAPTTDNAEVTVRQMIQEEIKAALGDAAAPAKAESKDDSDVDDAPAEAKPEWDTSDEALEAAALRHILATRHPNVDINAELQRVQGLEFLDDGTVGGDVQYEPSAGMTIRRRAAAVNQADSAQAPTTRTRAQSIGDMTPEQIRDLARAENNPALAEMQQKIIETGAPQADGFTAVNVARA